MSTNESTPLLEVKNLSHRYETQYALKNVSFSLENRGEIIGLLGSNGAGKSTMMNIICGALTQTEGIVKIDGHDNLKDRIEAKSVIGFLPQKPPLHTDLTVSEYLRYSAALRRIPRNEVKDSIARVLKRCEITHFKDRLIKNLSGGYQQRVGIAQSIIHNPRFIVLDEPTNGLDPNQILEIRELIKDIAKERLVMLSTHILQEVQAMCHQILMIEGGEFVFKGTMDEFNNTVVSNKLILTTQKPLILDEIKSIPHIIDVIVLEDNKIECIVDTDDVDLQSHIIKTSVEKDWQLLEIYKEKSNPDEIFKYLSKGIH